MPKMVALSTSGLLRSSEVVGMHESRMAAWMTLLQAHAAVVAALGEKLEQERGLPLSWYEVLVQLSAAPEGKLTSPRRIHSAGRMRARPNPRLERAGAQPSRHGRSAVGAGRSTAGR